MNKNGEKTKLLAAVAVLAMIMCVFAVAVPMAEGADEAAVDGSTIIDMADDNGVITLDKDYTVKSVITVTGALTINGNGHTITADSSVSWTGVGNKNILSIENVGATVTINNVTFDSSNKAYGLNVDSRSNIENNNVVLNDVTVKNSKGAGLTVNDNSNAEVNDSSFSDNEWGDINVDKASTLTIDDATELTSNFQIWSEDVTAAENPSVINADSYVAYKWVKESDEVTDGRAYFKNGNTAGDLTLASGETLTVEKDQYLFVNGAFSGKGTIEGVYFLMPAGTTSSISGSTITVSGSAATSDTTDAIYNKYFSSVEKGVWAYAGIVGLQGEDVKIKQTNPALSAAWPSDTNFSKNVKEKTYTFDESDDEYMFLVPAGKSVTIEMTGGIAATYVFNFSGVDKTTEFSGSANASDVNAAIKDGSMAVINTTNGTIPDDLQVTDAGLQINAETTAVSGTFSVGDYSGEEGAWKQTATVQLSGFIGTIEIYKGSVIIDNVYIDENMTAGKVTITGETDITLQNATIDGDLEISVPAGADFKVGKNVIINDTLTISGGSADKPVDVTMSRSNTLTIDGTLTLGTNVNMDSKGTITTTVDVDTVAEDAKPKIVNNGVFSFTGNLNGVVIKPTDTGSIVNANTSFENATFDSMKINNKTVFDGSENYSFTINGDVVVQEGANFLVGGKLIVPTGSTLTVEKGGILNIKNTAIADIAGELVLEEGAKFVYNGYTMTVSGTVTVEGNIDGGFNGKNVTVSGTMNIEDKAAITITSAITVAAGGNLNIEGDLIGTVVNAGTVTIDSDADLSGLTISMRDGGIVNAQNVRGSVQINDDGMTFKTGGKDVDVDTNPKSPANTITLENVTGVTVTETLTMSTDKDGNRIGTSHMYISGNVGNTKDADNKDETAKITASTGMTVEVADELTFAKGAQFVINGATVIVSGAVTSTAENGTVDVTSGALTVTGTVTVKTEIDNQANVNAAHYVSGTGTDAVHVYSTLEAALAAGADEIDVFGDITIKADATIPVGTDVTLDNGATIVIDEGVTLSVAAEEKTSGTLDNSNGKITVKGTLYVANLERSDLDSDSDAVVSDVTLYDEPSATFTSVANALAAAQPGSTVEITGDNVLISKDLTIPAGVTLLIPSEKNVDVKAGVTVTVDGTLTVEGATGYEMLTDEDDSGEDIVAKTIVNGMVKTVDDAEFVNKDVAGAYYIYDGYDCISPLEVADDIVNDIESTEITVRGDVTSGDVSFAYDGGDGVKTLKVNATATLTVSSLAADNMTIVLDGMTNGTITVADGTFAFVNVKGATITDVVSYTQDNAEQHVAVLTGTEIINCLDPAKDVQTALDGSVTVSGTAQIGSDAENADKTYFKVDIIGNSKATMTVTVASGANVELANVQFDTSAVIDGTAVLIDAGVDFNKTLTVTGSIAAEEGETYTADAAETVYVGITSKDYYLGAAASVADVKLGDNAVAIVGPGATIADDIVEDDKMNSTAFYVNGELYATVYTLSASENINNVIDTNGEVTDESVVKAPVVENAFFAKWVDDEGKDLESDAAVGDVDAVYAKINTMIYKVTILANQAVDDITIDGNLMQYGVILDAMFDDGTGNQVYYGYTATVDAGTHKILYTLKNGYSGEGVLTCVSGGAVVSGLDFTAAGTPEAGSSGTISYTFQLTGFDKTGYVPESPDTDSSDDSANGLGITDYLLIVLVVLIIVMAIIVAMRLMRS